MKVGSKKNVKRWEGLSSEGQRCGRGIKGGVRKGFGRTLLILAKDENRTQKVLGGTYV